ncbi:hypothetical protein ASG32_08160 [Methylobacterium sp. Leaf361]|uniref:hypothetical protein n=1 Tax=Methylobacterium sp. Leaf361 TaxID=1736352 RepID=UPI0006FE222C|nr:hypothetical protein [Methylobacterium sp. Leaf361]KQS75061.1 hypothetical protein ASG32_08160 [Methylobacterium sp. Leaf361]
MTGNFYQVGLGLLMKDVQFTQDELAMLAFLCKHAARGDAEFEAALDVIHNDLAATKALNRLKDTFRSLGKAPILQAHYDRANRVYG